MDARSYNSFTARRRRRKLTAPDIRGESAIQRALREARQRHPLRGEVTDTQRYRRGMRVMDEFIARLKAMGIAVEGAE